MDRVFSRIYLLRSYYGPTVDIVIHANDMKSAFHQVKFHPNIMGSFSYIISGALFLSCGQPFHTNFNPSNWEVVRQVLEHFATQLFYDKSLHAKHGKFLGRLTWDCSLNSQSSASQFTKAQWDALNAAIMDASGNALPTPHYVYVDDNIDIDIFSVIDFEKCIAATIKDLHTIRLVRFVMTPRSHQYQQAHWHDHRTH